MFIGKQFDMIIGVDIHIVQPPGPVPPVPIPHPFIGIVFDPMEFVPFIGASILVNGIPRAQAGTAVKSVPPHIPIGGMFIKPPMSEGEIFMGSMTVNAEGEPLAYMGAPTLTCQDVGMVSIPRPKRKSKTKAKSMMLPTSSLICIPKGGMSMALGALMISMVAIGMKVGLSAFKKLKIKKGRKAYEAEVKKLSSVADSMRAAGKSSEEIARHVHDLRRQLGVKYKNLTPPAKLKEIYERNVKKYGDKLGPTVDYLRAKGKSWDDIIDSACRPGGKDLKF